MENKYLIKLEIINKVVEMNYYQRAAVDGIEIWLPYKQYRGRNYKYCVTDVEISNLGNVRGIVAGKKFEKQETGRNTIGGTPVFHLVYALFVGNYIPGNDIHHIDEDKTNDACCNLIMITHAEHTMIHTKGKKNSEETAKKKREHLRTTCNNTKGKHRYNNGEIEILAFDCPEGFTLGRLKPAWNKNLTKETDERVAKYGNTHAENNKNKCQ